VKYIIKKRGGKIKKKNWNLIFKKKKKRKRKRARQVLGRSFTLAVQQCWYIYTRTGHVYKVYTRASRSDSIWMGFSISLLMHSRCCCCCCCCSFSSYFVSLHGVCYVLTDRRNREKKNIWATLRKRNSIGVNTSNFIYYNLKKKLKIIKRWKNEIEKNVSHCLLQTNFYDITR
jgi:hypothetical protein